MPDERSPHEVADSMVDGAKFGKNYYIINLINVSCSFWGRIEY